MFTGLAAVSGTTSAIVLHRMSAGATAPVETGSIGGQISRSSAATLARSTLSRLDDANRSGNYDVFRGMAAPGFQSINSAADLARIFAWLRQERIALEASALDERELKVQTVEPRGLLRLNGRVAANPQPVDFDLMFQDVGGEWRLFGIAIFKS
jgi:hypothetical protein